MPTARSLMPPLSPLALPLASEQMLSHGDQESHGDLLQLPRRKSWAPESSCAAALASDYRVWRHACILTLYMAKRISVTTSIIN